MSLTISEADGSFKLVQDSKKTKKPKSDDPKSDTPKSDTPKSDTPKSDTPKSDSPPDTFLNPRGTVITQETVLQRQEKNFVDSLIQTACWTRAMGHAGPSSSSLSTSLISSPTLRNTPVGLCSLSCVVFCERSSIIPSSPSSFPQREAFINSLRRYDRTLQGGSQTTN